MESNVESMETVYCRNAEEWRTWLRSHGEDTPEIWLIYLKKGVDEPCITYAESVDEALCCGWIDGLIRKIDETKYVRRFTPRTRDSRWSEINVRRMRALIESDRATPHAIAEFQRAIDEDRVVHQPKNPVLPEDLLKELRSDAEAFALFEQLSPAHRRQYILWIMEAKREQTRYRRVEKAREMLRSGWRPGI